MQFRHPEMFAAQCAVDRFPDARLRLFGIDADTRGAIEFLSTGARAGSGRIDARQGSLACWCANVAMALAAAIAFPIALLRLTRLKPPPPRDCYLMADYVADPADDRVYEAAARRGDVVLVPRTRGMNRPGRLNGKMVEVIPNNGGTIPLAGYPAEAFRLLFDLGRILRNLGWLRPAQFLIACAWPYKQRLYAALFRRCRPIAFYARDTYNPEHILRHGELRAVGAQHLGLNIGYPCYSIMFPTMRYLAFDSFLVYGRKLYEDHYAGRWPDDMTLVPIGPFRVFPRTVCRRTSRMQEQRHSRIHRHICT